MLTEGGSMRLRPPRGSAWSPRIVPGKLVRCSRPESHQALPCMDRPAVRSYSAPARSHSRPLCVISAAVRVRTFEHDRRTYVFVGGWLGCGVEVTYPGGEIRHPVDTRVVRSDRGAGRRCSYIGPSLPAPFWSGADLRQAALFQHASATVRPETKAGPHCSVL